MKRETKNSEPDELKKKEQDLVFFTTLYSVCKKISQNDLKKLLCKISEKKI